MPDPRLEKLKQQQAQLAAKIKNIEAREREKERKNDTRRKVIAGALALHHMEKNPNSDFAKLLGRLLDEYVTRANERDLFGLPPLPEDAAMHAANDDNPLNAPSLREEFQAGQ